MAEPITLARPYAKAAFEQAREAGALAEWDAQLALAAAIASDRSVREHVLDNPLVEPEAASAFFLDVGGDRFEGDFRNMLQLLAENRRLAVLPQVSELFARYRAAAERTLDVEVTTAVPAPEGFDQRLAEALGERFKRDVSVAMKVDESLLGGAVVRAGDTVFDGSLRGKLTSLASDIGR